MSKRSQLAKTKVALAWLVVSLTLAYFLSLIFLRNGLPLPVSFYLVQSGSMAPAINTGDVVVIKSQPQYHERETITFYDDNHRVVTHRIVRLQQEGGVQQFITKGDANEDRDAQVVDQSRVIGQVVMVLPKLGFVVSFAKTRYGALLLIVVPAVIIVYDEFSKMSRAS